MSLPAERSSEAAVTAMPAARRRSAHAYLLRHRWARVLAQCALLAVVLAGYSGTVALSPALSRFMPSLGELLGSFALIFSAPKFWESVGHTAVATLLGLLISLIAGSAIGMLVSSHRNTYRSAQFIIDFMRTIPPLALIPVGLLLLGPTLQMEVTLIVVAAVWPVLIQVHYGISNIDPKLIETGRSFRMSAWRRAMFIKAPAVGPTFATAVRLSATLCLLLAVGTELIAGGSGLGYLVGWYQNLNRLAESYAVIIVIGCIGVLLNLGIQLLERRLFAWHRREAKGAEA